MEKRSGHQKAALLGNKVPSRNRSGSGMNPLFSRSSRSFMGSKSNLQSASKKNLSSDSTKALRLAQIFDEDGFNVTPVSLLQQEQTVPRKNQINVFKVDGATPNVSMFQTSIYGAGATQMSGASIIQPFSRSVFSTTDMGISGLSTSIDDTRLLAREKQPSIDSSTLGSFPDALKELTPEDLEKEVEFVLSETETIMMLDIPGTCVALDSDEAQVVKENNERYEDFLRSHSGNDNYAERAVQTLNNAPTFKQVQTETLNVQDQATSVSTWDMYNTYETIYQGEGDAHEDETIEELNSRAVSRMTNVSGTTAGSRLPSSIGGRMTKKNTSKIPGESSVEVSMIDSVGSTSNPNVVPKRKCEEKTWDPSMPNGHPILKSESLKNSFRIIERAITQNIYHVKQAMYRNMEPVPDPDYPSPGVNIILTTPHLDKLWTYSCSLTRKRKVTCLAWNNSNKDVIAVGYGTFKAKEDGTGLICCWSIKNPEFPERIFHSPSGITSLSFSYKNPNLLAAGLFNGSIVLYNARSTLHDSVLDSKDALHKHSAPVWQINWVMKEYSLGESKTENLISISVDGHILQWSIRKGFESTQLMNLKRMLSIKQQVKKSRSKASLAPASAHGPKRSSPKGQLGGGEAYISQHAPGMGFDFWPKDPNIYLACTDEGFIHKCSCSYNEQVLETYVGHTGPVYRVSWSPFVADYFLSCSADWSVKLWAQDKTTPIQSFSAAQKTVNDVCWSPFSSTVFGCVSEGRVEIWDLNYSSLDPLIVHRPLSAAVLTCLTFAHNSREVIVGDTNGEVSVYLLSNLPPFPLNQEEALLAAIYSMSKKEHIVSNS